MSSSTEVKKCLECDYCGKSFAQKSALATHIRIHTGERPFECEMCERAFVSKGELKSHVRSHTGEKPFRCELCDKFYSQVGKLNEHMRSHTGDRPFKCELCVDVAYFTRNALATHAAKKHGVLKIDARPFECSICGERFSGEKRLESHARSHLGDKPFRCDQCGKGFPADSKLKRHMVTHEKKWRRRENAGGRGDQREKHLVAAEDDFAAPATSGGSSSGRTFAGDEFAKTEKLLCPLPPSDDPLVRLASVASWPEPKTEEKTNPPPPTVPPPSVSNFFGRLAVSPEPKSEEEKLFPGADGDPRLTGGSAAVSPAAGQADNVPYPDSSHHPKLDNYKPKFENNHPNFDNYDPKADNHRQKLDKYNPKSDNCNPKSDNLNPKLDNYHPRLDSYIPRLGRDEHYLAVGGAASENDELERDDCSVDIQPRDYKREMLTPPGTMGQVEGGNNPALEDNSQVSSSFAPRDVMSAEGIQKSELDCDFCGKKFAQRGNLVEHIRTHTGERPFNCDFCERAFPTKGQLKSHTRSHTGEKPYKCKHCDKFYTQAKSLNEHMRVHTGEVEFRCDLCDSAYNKKSNLAQHYKDKHGRVLNYEPKPFKCRLCGEPFASEKKVVLHIRRQHLGDNPFRCEACGKGFPCDSKLKRHMKTHTGGGDGGDPSSSLGRDGETTTGFDADLFAKYGERTLFKKPQAPRRIKKKDREQKEKAAGRKADAKTSPAALDFTAAVKEGGDDDGEEKEESFEDLEETVDGEMEEVDDDDGGDGRREDEGDADVGDNQPEETMSAEGIQKSALDCDFCGRKCASKSGLKEHLRTHTGEKPFGCELCDKAFVSKGQLKSHVRTHTGERPFKCRLCDKFYAHANKLTVHMRTHTGEVEFSCDLCPRTYNEKGNLAAHYKNKHGRVLGFEPRPFRCKICGEWYGSEKRLVLHIRSHLGDKPFKCETCGKGFTCESKWRRHVKTHGGSVEFLDSYDEDLFHRYGEKVLRIPKPKVDEPALDLSSGARETLAGDHEAVDSNSRVLGKDIEAGDPDGLDIGVDTQNIKVEVEEMQTPPHSNPNRFYCDLCDKSYAFRNKLTAHRKKHESKDPMDGNTTLNRTVEKMASNPTETKIKETRFRCDQCLKYFSDNYKLKRHMISHTGRKPFKCGQCGKRFSRKDKLKSHKKTHNNNGSLAVERKENDVGSDGGDSKADSFIGDYLQCELTLRAEDDQGLNESFASNVIAESLVDCDVTIKHEAIMDDYEHMINLAEEFGDAATQQLSDREEEDSKDHISAVDKISACPEVNFLREDCVPNTFVMQCIKGEAADDSSSSDLFTNGKTEIKKEVIEEASCTADRINSFIDCGATIKQEIKMELDNSDDRPAIPDYEAMVRELAYISAEGEEIVRYKCDVCGYSSPERTVLLSHIGSHIADRPFKCPQCDISFAVEELLTTHISGHMNEDEFGCSECSKFFPNERLLTKHERLHAVGYFACDECDETFDTRSELAKHKKVHAPTFKCEQCGKAFDRNYKLTRHLRTHSSDKPFKCDECGKAFSRRDKLSEHRLVHTGHKPFACDQCEKAFSRKDKLTAHKKTHATEETNYFVSTYLECEMMLANTQGNSQVKEDVVVTPGLVAKTEQHHDNV